VSWQIAQQIEAWLCVDEPRETAEIASKGGKSVPGDKRSFSQNRDLASQAGRKGGQVSGTVRQ
jgi:general stress protein YciG